MFRIADGSFGFRLDDIGEIVRLPRLAHMPLGPQSLLGLANLRGAVLPVVSLSCLLGFPDASPDDATRVIVIDHGAPVGFVVDRIDDLLALSADRIETDDAGAGFIDPDLLEACRQRRRRRQHDQDFESAAAAARRIRTDSALPRRALATGALVSPAVPGAPSEPQRQVSFVSFELGQQEYALPLEARARDHSAARAHFGSRARRHGRSGRRDAARSAAAAGIVAGPAGIADAMLHREQRGKVVVLSMGRGAVGLVADRTREILRVDPSLIDPAPALLTRGAGDAEITSICRLDHGKRLVAVLSPDRLFRSDLMRRVLSEQGEADDAAGSQTDGNAMAEEQFIVFRLGHRNMGCRSKPSTKSRVRPTASPGFPRRLRSSTE